MLFGTNKPCFLVLAMLALLWGCSSSNTLTRTDGGTADAKAEASDGGVDSAAPADTGGPDSTLQGDTSTPDTSSFDDTFVPDTSTPDTSIDAPADTAPPIDSAADSADTSPIGTLTVGGTITGTMGDTVTLQDNGSDNVTVSTDGSFTFPTPLATGAAFSVTVLSAPANLSCAVTSGTGTIASSNVTTVVVTCSPVVRDGGPVDASPVDASPVDASPVDSAPVDSAPGDTSTPPATVSIGGTVSGLAGTLVLDENGGDALTITSNGSFTFTTQVMAGSMYAVTVGTQPATQTCTVTMGSGTAVMGMNVTTVAVSCSSSASFTVGGTISGLAGNDSVQLQLNGADSTFFGKNGSFVFSTPLASGASYAVTVENSPAVPLPQTCTVKNGTGTVGSTNVSSVTITCLTNTYTISGWVTLVGTGADVITLTDNGGDNIVIQPGTTSPSAFTFATPITSSSAYSVVAKASGGTVIPCTAQAVGTMFQGVTAKSLAAGTVGSQNVAGILIECGP